ncbi:hypothetical protein CHU92_00140 [Flavobacterium cyanobacteriorum]|uniref:Uncharacterized protein n=1 Tax=Flavobacterium cyanobacteriorum TaxID=2022802 RepID=A0A256A9T7_9FLAO|nr:hypothetical protein [Flavobacterium cyanobacteriorum]OYQ50359.1 hypothetical protein CHU92_00140 [Flavobacterium cyanobacteriorum]
MSDIQPVEPPKFSKWYISLHPPKEIKEIDLPEYKSLELFVTDGSLRLDDVDFIIKINKDKYLMWTSFHIREK